MFNSWWNRFHPQLPVRKYTTAHPSLVCALEYDWCLGALSFDHYADFKSRFNSNVTERQTYSSCMLSRTCIIRITNRIRPGACTKISQVIAKHNAFCDFLDISFPCNYNIGVFQMTFQKIDFALEPLALLCMRHVAPNMRIHVRFIRLS